ncbi:unnamed protein product [Paramecium primaurelia]|uniref:Uncharacterized protein n=1 Tax=Paramecium primaurelia TaxID=5886 RepID=A0A8S1QMC8_PARPR|nr:unnamed protein product [Paramecium primaurelia]
MEHKEMLMELQNLKIKKYADITYILIECSSRLKSYTSEGVKCLVKVICKSFKTQSVCSFANDTERASFFWVAVNGSGICRIKVCFDIPKRKTVQASQRYQIEFQIELLAFSEPINQHKQKKLLEIPQSI